MKRYELTICGHRGAMGDAPENTLPAFYEAIRQHATMVELDVRYSHDQVLVVIHDAAVHRTTDGTGKVAELTWAQLKGLDAGSWFDARFAGARIPRLDDVLVAVGDKLLFNIEIKSGETPYIGIETSLIDVIESHGLVDRVVISSFEPIYLQNLRSLHPSLNLALLYSNERPDVVQDVLEHHWQGIHPHKSLVTEELVKQAHAHGLNVRAWTVNDESEMRRLLEIGVDSIITDYPRRLHEVARSMGLV